MIRLFLILFFLLTVSCSDDASDNGDDTSSDNLDSSSESDLLNDSDSNMDTSFGDTGSDTENRDTESDSGTENMDTETDTVDSDPFVPPDDLLIQAECAFGIGTGDCTGAGAVDGTNINLADNPQLENGDTTVGYIDSGIWLSYPGIDLTDYNSITINVSSDGGGGTYEIRIDSPDGQLIGTLTLPDTGDWTAWEAAEADLMATSGVHTLYIVGGGTNDTGIGNLDWFMLKYIAPPTYLDIHATVSDRVEDLLSRMTLNEKAGQMAQGAVSSVSTSEVTSLALGSVLSGGSDGPYPYGALDWADHTDKYQQAALNTRLGIPLLYGIDAVHGHGKLRGATIIPHNIGLGATRDLALVKKLGRLTGVELAATGCFWTFAPAVSVARDIRWGRTYESFGESPDLVSSMTTFIEGLQGTDLSQSGNVLATAKHYAGDGGATWGTGISNQIDQGDAIMSEESLRAIHIRPYYDAVDKGIGSIMPSYSSFNGVKMHENGYLINTVLRDEIGFTGFTISDWDAVYDLSAGSFAGQIRDAVNAGVDMFMYPQDYSDFITTLISLVGNGVTQSTIDNAVRRILTVKISMGLFEHPFADRTLISEIYSDSHRALAREAVRKSLVLLKNTGSFLPLSSSDSVCLTGSGANSVENQSGGWTLGWTAPSVTPIGETVREALDSYLSGKTGNRVTTGCNVGISVITEDPATYAEMYGDMANPSHDNSQSCTAANGCVLVILGGRPLNIEAILNDSKYKAVVMAFYPGSEGGGIIDDLYSVNGAKFTGKLPMTWPVDAVNTPVNYCNSNGADNDNSKTADECEDTGAHYSNTSNPPASVLFPYGYGLTD
ncbi:MAG: carbohydrate-binding protein [Deltaproteobacteria bacterium]|nr:carbohydrate-binding protein [Deltaproteobacteria bacterium]